MDNAIQELKRKAATGDEEAAQELLKARARAGEIKIVEIRGHVYQITPYGGRRTDSWGNNPACNCPDLMQIHTFCVCIARVWCEKHGGPRCVGGHDQERLRLAPQWTCHCVYSFGILYMEHVMTKELTGTCEGCNKRKPTKLVADDWTTYLTWYEMCYDCMSDDV